MTDDVKAIEKRILEILADRASMDEELIKLDSLLVEDLGMDSLDAVEMVFEIEELYGIDIPNEQITEFKMVQDLVRYLSDKLIMD